MRISTLRLLAYGHFTDEELDLSAAGSLQLVHGPNEAGKSTALRAITGLLFGIPERTSDAHVHAMNKLRIGARLVSGDEVFEVVRKKGRKNTLLGVDGQPLDEGQLKRALAGVSEAIFRNMFGLDHVSLREGARTLLAGEGGLGESLFDAGGARGIGTVLAGLRDDAAAIFKPRGKTQDLNLAIEAHEEAKKAIKLKGTEPRGWAEQKKALEAAVDERAARASTQQQLATEQNRLHRALRVMPLLSRRRQLVARREALGSLPRLPDDAVALRSDAEQRLRECARDRQRLEGEIARLREQLAAIDEPGSLAALDEELVATLQDQGAVLRKAALDLPRRRERLAELEAQIERQARELGRDPDDTHGSLRVDKPTLARIEALADRHGRLAAAAEASERALGVRRRRLADLGDRDGASGKDVDLEEASAELLEAAVARATRVGDLDTAVARAAEQRKHAADGVARGLARLGIPGRGAPGHLEQALALALPASAWVVEQQEIDASHDAAAGALASRLAQLQATAAKLDDATAELKLGGEVPSEEELAAARRERGGTWLQARAAAAGEGGLSGAVLDEHERLSERADELADRLRSEASRVERHLRLRLDRSRLEEERARLTAEEAELKQSRQEAQARWQARLAEAGLEPTGPAEMLALLERQAELRDRAEALAAAELEERSLLAQREQLRETLTAALASASSAEAEVGAASDLLAPVVDRASLRLQTWRRRRGERERLLQTIADAEADLAGASADHEAASQALARWREGWAAEMPKLGMSAEASVDEVKVVLVGLRELSAELHKADDLRRRIEAMERDAKAFADLLRPICEIHAPDLGARGALDAAGELLHRAERARTALSRRGDLTREVEGRMAELDGVELSRQQAEAVLADLFAIAGVSDVSGLTEVETRWGDLMEIERQLRETDASLLEEGATVDELEDLTRDLDLDGVRARLTQIELELEDVAQDLTDLDQRIGSTQRGLEESFAEREGAHMAANDQQACLARIRRLSERYAKLTLAAAVLEREIERYRERNQGPVITRASELFPVLSLGEYTQVRVSFDASDEPELRCVGVDGADVGVDGLSDGARDQLYLALRLASLERYAEQRELLPFIADDILVHFDEERASAALRVLAEFASVTQVLMFTHHARHVELAREVVPADRLVVHQLAGRRRSAKAR